MKGERPSRQSAAHASPRSRPPASPPDQATALRGRKRWVGHRGSHRIIYRMVSFACAYFPRAVSRLLWFMARHIASLFLEETLAATSRNYELAFRLDSQSASRQAKELLRQYGLTTIDLFRTRVGGPDRIPIQSRHARDDRVLAQTLRGGRGCLVVTGHLGNWELGGIHLAAHGFKVTMLGQPELDPDIQALRQEIRERFGIGWIEIGDTMATAFRVRRAIDRGEIVAFLADRSFPEDRIAVEFFGRPTYFLRSPAQLARFCSCAIMPCYFTRSEDGSYRSHFGSPVVPNPEAPTEEEARRVMTEVASVVERAIREEPTQWYNFYDYWDEAAPRDPSNSPSTSSRT